MNYLYKIHSSFDGFTPEKIRSRLHDGKYLAYNWNQYFDGVEIGDVVFTYFTGKGVTPGVYLISRVTELLPSNRVMGKVLCYKDKPLIPQSEFQKIRTHVLTRPRGSVYVIPPFLDPIFDDVRRKTIFSVTGAPHYVKCIDCYGKRNFDCERCLYLEEEYLVDWDREVNLEIEEYEKVVSAYWIIPRQRYPKLISIKNHPISMIFYAFKSGYEQYAVLFAHAIHKAICNHSDFKKTKIDYIIGVPLSPSKKKEGEFDRIRDLCLILRSLINTEYIENGLSLSHHISRKEYKSYGRESDFYNDYYKYLSVRASESLNEKTVLIIDDVITDGKTLEAISKKIKEKYPNCVLFAATAGIMAKKSNMTNQAIMKFSK